MLNKLSAGSTHVRRFDNNSLLNNGKRLSIHKLVLHIHTGCSAPRGPDPLTHGQAGGAAYDPEGEKEDEEQEYNFNDNDEEEDDRRKESEDRGGKKRKVQEVSEDEDD